MDKSEIQVFVFNWKNQFEKTCRIENSLHNIFDDITVINSDDDNTREGWVNIGDECYFSDQFRKALSLYKSGKTFFHVQGDVTYDKWASLVDDAIKYHAKYGWGIFTPDITNIWYTSENTDIKGVWCEEKNLRLIANADNTVWFIHHDIMNKFIDGNCIDYFRGNTKGWGWDLVMSSLCFLNRRPVIRDYNHVVVHPVGTNYDKSDAMDEMSNLIQMVPEDMRECIYHIKGNRENLVKYLAQMDNKYFITRLEGLPRIYWINLEADFLRREHMEKQFEYWHISNHQRVNGYDGRLGNIHGNLEGGFPADVSREEVGCCLSHLKAIKTFYEETDDDYCFIAEDDLLLDTTRYWNFTWEDFIAYLPVDWDCVQLSIISTGILHVRLHQHFMNDFSAVAYLITRHHAEKIIRNHVRGDRYKIDNGIRPRPVSEDLIFGSGKTYTVPLFVYRLDLGSAIHSEHIDMYHKHSYQAIVNFWEKQGHRINIRALMEYDPYLNLVSSPPPGSTPAQA